MKANTGHIIFKEGIEYVNLAEHMEEIMNMFFLESEQVPEDEEYAEMLKTLNRTYLEMNQKPEGYNRPGRMRLIFPLRNDDRVEMYLSGTGNNMEVMRVTETFSAFFTSLGMEHEVKWDQIMKKEDFFEK